MFQCRMDLWENENWNEWSIDRMLWEEVKEKCKWRSTGWSIGADKIHPKIVSERFDSIQVALWMFQNGSLAKDHEMNSIPIGGGSSINYTLWNSFNLLSLIKPYRFTALHLQCRHNNIDIIVAQSEQWLVRIDPFIRWQLSADVIQLGFRIRTFGWKLPINNSQFIPHKQLSRRHPPWNRLFNACNAHSSRICRSWYTVIASTIYKNDVHSVAPISDSFGQWSTMDVSSLRSVRRRTGTHPKMPKHQRYLFDHSL